MINKLILGTANFDLNYGIKNKYKRLKKKEIKKIIYSLKKNKINYIDTSQNYNNTEKILGDLNIKKFKVCTKFTFNENIKNIVKDKFLSTTKNLRTKSIHTVLFHRPSDLLKKNGKLIFNEIVLLKKKGFIKKIGISSDKKSELKKILDKYKFDIVQVPINIFNQSFLEKKFLNYLKKKKVEIHARSVFLQGLLLMREKKIPKFFLKNSNIMKKWNLWLKKNKITNLEACLNFITSQKIIKKFVLGVDSLRQLNEILNFKKSKKKFNFDVLQVKISRIMLPQKWYKK